MKTPIFRDTYKDGTSIKEQYWDKDNTRIFYDDFRPGGKIPRDMISTVNSVKKIDEYFNLKGVQFGNWLTTEDKYNYLAITYICLRDINKVLKFPNNNLGLNGRLAIAFGSRGVSSALAHFESTKQVINITRYHRHDKIRNRIRSAGRSVAPGTLFSKSWRLLNTGGGGSFAHEYGHFIDFMFGYYVETDKDSAWLTGEHRTVARTIDKPSSNHKMRILMKDVFDTVLFNKDGSESQFSKRLDNYTHYINRRLEIWARIFEHYIAFKLKEMNITNRFLSKPVYRKEYYLTGPEMAKVVPKIDLLIKEMRKNV
jgi:hypothetical protein